MQRIKKFDANLIIDPNKGIHRKNLIDNAWQIFNKNKISIDVSTRIEISRIYEQQKYVTNALKNSVNFLKSREILRIDLANENYIMFTKLLGDLWGQENAMIREIKIVIQNLEN